MFHRDYPINDMEPRQQVSKITTVALLAHVIYNLGTTWSAGGDCNTNMDWQCPAKSSFGSSGSANNSGL